MECGEASWGSPEGTPPSFICILLPVSPSSPEPGTYRWLWHCGSRVETWCWWSEWAVAGGVWGPLQFHQHPLFWCRRYWVNQITEGSLVGKAFCVLHLRLESSVFQKCIYFTLVKKDAVLSFYVELGRCPNKLLKLLLFWLFFRKTNVLCRQHRPHHCVENICESGPAAGPMSPVVHRHGTRSKNLLF